MPSSDPQHKPDLSEQMRRAFQAQTTEQGPRPGPDAADSPGAPADKLEHLGDYRILREIGRGGMGVVYEAEQVSLGRHVALKVLPSHGLLNPTSLERFKREARAAARLHHTNIVPVFGVGECDGVHFYAMQFIHGEGLDRVLADLRRLRQLPAGGPAPPTVRGDRLLVAQSLLTGHFPNGGLADDPARTTPQLAPPPAEPEPPSDAAPSSRAALSQGQSTSDYHRSVARVGLQAAEALAYAHRQGVLHRDIKPSNLLLDLQGTVWVTDFGLAKTDDAEDLTHTGDVVGTLRYMPPERFDGRSLPQSDVYALGLTLYEMLTLRPAYSETNRVKLVEMVLHQAPVSPRQIEPGVPRDLETIVLKCLHKDPAERYASAEDLAEDLRRFLADRPIKARPVTLRERLWRWRRRNPVVAALSVAVFLLLVLLAGVGIASAIWFRASLVKSNELLDKANRAEADRLKQLYHAHIAEANAGRFSRRQGQRFASLAAVHKARQLLPQLGLTPAEEEEQRQALRTLAITCLSLPDVRVVQEWHGLPKGSHALVADDGMELYARVDQQGNLTVRQLRNDRELASFPGDGLKFIPLFTPDGRYLFRLRSKTRIEGVRLVDRQVVCQIDTPAEITNQRITRDGQGLLLSLADNHVQFHHLPSGRLTRRLKVTPHPHQVLTLSPDGAWLAVATGSTTQESPFLWVHDLRGQREPLALRHDDGVYSACWYPDSRTLASSTTTRSGIHVWDVPSGRCLQVIRSQKGGAPTLGINSTGELLASVTGWWGGLRLWHAPTGREVLNVPSYFNGVAQAAPDGRLFACMFNKERVQLHEVLPGRSHRFLTRDLRGEKDKLFAVPSLHPAGRLLAVGMENGVGLWDVVSGREVGFLPVDYTETVVFESSGDLLTYGYSGLLRWPVRTAGGGKLRVGPPQRIFSASSWDRRIDVARDAGVIAAGGGDAGVYVFLPGPSQRRLQFGPLRDARRVAVTPDGRYVAAASFNRSDIRIWEVATGKEVARLEADGGIMRFTPDGKWLIAVARWFEVGTWKERAGVKDWRLGTISPDGKLLALEGIQLFDRASGKLLAKLEHPDHGRLPFMTFSPDGSLLIASDMDNLGVHVWDLRRLRQRLKEIDLDWDTPDYPPPAEGVDAPPLEVELVGAGLGRDFRGWNQAQGVLAAFSLLWNPASAQAYLRLGMLEMDAGRAERALDQLESALRLQPDLWPARLNRLMAAERLGRWREVCAEADRLLADDPGCLAARFRRARARQQLQQHAGALEDLNEMLRWFDHDPELYLRRADCHAALGHQDRARDDRKTALSRIPDHLNNAAWRLANGPPPTRDLARARELIRLAVEKDPKNREYLNTLGIILYRQGQYREAAATLEESLKLGGARDGFDLYFLALCQAQLGQPGLAKQTFERANRWLEENSKAIHPRELEELKEHQAQAQAELQRLSPGPKEKMP